MSDKKKEGLTSKQDMKAKGKGTGKIAARNFQYDGKFHAKGEEIKGLSEKDLKVVEDQGLIKKEK